MEQKTLPPAKINIAKFLKSTNFSAVKKINVKKIDGNVDDSNTFIIKKHVIEIRDLIKTNTLLKKQEEDKKRKNAERKKFSERESELESKKEKSNDKIKLPSTPKLGFLERIKQFLFNLILGKIALTLLPHLPKLSGTVNTILKVQDTIIDWSGKILNGLVTFVDKGYEIYDKSRKLLNNIGGENFTKVFDSFNGAIGNVIEASIIAALAFGDLGGGDGGGPVSGGKYGQRLPGGTQRGLLTKLGRRAFVGVLGKGGAKAVLKTVRPLLKRIPLPIVGALIDFGLSVALGENPGRAAFKAIGAGLLGAVGAAAGSVLPFAGTFLGGLAGGALGDMAGGALYDVFFGNKTPQKQKVQGRAQGGGVTRAGKIQSGPSRRIKKSTKREVGITPTPLTPGSEVGGEKKITKLFPKRDEKDRNKDKTVNPLGYIESVYNKASKINYFGPLFGLIIKKMSGDKVDKVDYKNVGKSLNSWMSNTFDPSGMSIGGFAEGGEVNAQMFMSGEDLTNVIAKSVEETVSSKLDKVLDDLEKQLMLKPKEVEKDKKVTEPSSDEDLGNATEMVGGARLLMAAGFPPLAAAILAGNIQAESAWKGQRTPWVLNDGAGTNKGLISWNRSRIVNAEKFLGKPLETATNAEQIKWIKEELRQYGLLDEFMNPQSTEDQLKRASYKYIGWGIEGDRWKYSKQIFSALEKGEKGSYVAGVPSSTSLGTSTGNLSAAQQLASSMGLQMTSYVRPGDSGYHGKGRAMDFSNDSVGRGTPQQMQFAQSMINRYGASLKELIYTPLGYGIKDGKQVKLDYWGDKTNAEHYNHVHVAFKDGGKVKGLTRAILGEEGPEFVIDADSTKALELNYPGFLDALNKADYSGALKVLQSYASYETGSTTYVYVDEKVIPIPIAIPSSQQLVSTFSGSSDYEDYMSSSYKG